MTISRRDFLKVAGLAVGCALAVPETVQASLPPTDPNEQIAMLYDATICVGCNACTNACRQWNGTTPEPDARLVYDAPTELSADTFTLIQLYQGEDGVFSFVKRQCMHFRKQVMDQCCMTRSVALGADIVNMFARSMCRVSNGMWRASRLLPNVTSATRAVSYQESAVLLAQIAVQQVL